MAKERVLMTIRKSLRPELLNRLDDVVVFNPLVGNVLHQVVRLQLKDVLERLEEMDVHMQITDVAVQHVLQEAHDPEMGARPLKRYLERHLVSRLSALILKDELKPGSDITVDWVAQAGTKGDWNFMITNTCPHIDGEEPFLRTTSSTLGRAGSHDTYEADTFERADSSSKRARTARD